MGPEPIWRLSRAAYRRGWTPLAKLLKLVNYFVFRCVLPYEVQVEGEVHLLHRGLGVVLEPNVRIVGPVTLAQGVGVGIGASAIEDGPGVTLMPNSFVGVGATVLVRKGRPITIGRNAAVGANVHLVESLPDWHRVAAPPPVLVRSAPRTPGA